MDYAKKFYRSKNWRKLRDLYMANQNYICERCGNLAHIVHHTVYITPQNINDPAVTLQWDNLEALCIDCHNSEHMGSEIIAEGLRFDSNGDIVSL